MEDFVGTSAVDFVDVDTDVVVVVEAVVVEVDVVLVVDLVFSSEFSKIIMDFIEKIGLITILLVPVNQSLGQLKSLWFLFSFSRTIER